MTVYSADDGEKLDANTYMEKPPIKSWPTVPNGKSASGLRGILQVAYHLSKLWYTVMQGFLTMGKGPDLLIIKKKNWKINSLHYWTWNQKSINVSDDMGNCSSIKYFAHKQQKNVELTSCNVAPKHSLFLDPP